MKNRAFNLFTLFALLLSLVGSLASVTPVYAAGIVVNSNADTVADDGVCTLREAITAANTDTASGLAANECAAGSGTDTITFSANYTITLSDQLPSVTTTITITGNGAANTIIQANAAANTATYRVFEVSTGNLTLDSLTVQYGRCNGSCASINGGGGILNGISGTLTVTNSNIANNSVNAYGGGIYNSGTLTVMNSSFSGNSTGNIGGGIYNNGTLTVENSIFSSNSATNYGGGIYNFSTLTVTNSTFSSNSSSFQGGGIYNHVGTLTIANSTITSNSASSSGDGIFNISGTLNLANTIIANSTMGADCVNFGTIGTNTNNLIEATGSNACGLTDDVNGNIIGEDPALGPLADNGGPTQTHALLTSSPAIGAGLNSVCDDNPGPNNLDQRGLTRPQGTNCDIGAYESNTQQEFSLVVNTNEDTDDGFCDAFVAGVTDCTLREAINYANNTGGTWTITFAANYTITLTNQLAAIGQIIINGNGASNTIIQANANPNTANRRVFQVNSGSSLTLNQVTVRHGYCNGLCEAPTTVGGGISVKPGGTLAINNSLISANYAEDGGGGLHTSSGGTVTIKNSTFSDNSTLNSGGAITNQGTMTISNSTVANNAATSNSSYAGGIRTGGIGTALSIYNSTISGNISNSGVDDGSNLYHDSGTGSLNLYNTIIANGSDGDCVAFGTFSASNTLIENNGTSDCGLTNGVNGNITGSDPDLGSLTGAPAYFPLNTGSPAIDAGDNTICDAAPVNNESQNGVTRPEGSTCDIGSFEFDYSPTVSSVTRVSTSPTSAASVDFTVTFSEAVQNVGVNDFTLTKSSGISGESVSAISGSGAVYTVTVNTGSGSGTLRLDIPVSATIQDMSNNALSGLPFTSGESYTKTTSATYKSTAANDGWILESSETSNTGGTLNSAQTTITLGDDAADKQYRAILHFDTSALPDNAVVTNMTLKIKQQGSVTGTSPFSFGSLYVDMRNPAFGGSALELTDFNFAAKKVKSAIFNPTPVSGWFSARFNNGGNLYINRTGVSQLRLYFSVDDNNNNIADFIRFFSGNAAAGDRPKLLITYYVP